MFYFTDFGLNSTNLKHASPRKESITIHTCPSAPGYIDEVTENMSIKESKSSNSMTESKPVEENNPVDEEKKDGSEDEMESSDDSYVKVVF